jgi:Thioredoxin-like
LKIRRGLLSALAVLLGAWGCGSDTFQPLSGWMGDLKAARMEAAAGKGKPLAILYTATWSGKCSDFAKRTLADPAVSSALQGFVKVNVNIDLHKENSYGVKSVPALVLVSPLGEVLSLQQGDYPADYLADRLEGLGRWKTLDGWEPDVKQAEAEAKKSGKPLAVLYSEAWNADAQKYEREGLADAREVLATHFTLLRLNYAVHKEEALEDGVKSGSQVPALVLHRKVDQKIEKVVIPGKHSAELLTGFVKSLGSYRSTVPGWSSDLEVLTTVRREEKGGPVAVVLDKANDWQSHLFLEGTLQKDDIALRLKGFARIRVKYVSENMPFLTDIKIRVRSTEVPCILVFDGKGKYYQKRTWKEAASSIVNLLR